MNPLAVRFLAVLAGIGALFVGTTQAAQTPQPAPVGPGDDGTGTGGLDDLVPVDNMPQQGYTPARNDTIVSVRAAGAGWTEVNLADGRVERRQGVRSWRNNNPGNIEYGTFAQANGAVGTDGRFAVFPTYEAGRAAKAALIFEGGNYKNLTLSAAIARYAPASENNTAWYAKTVLASVSGSDKRMSDFAPAERVAILDAMERVEGFKVGAVQQLGTGVFA